MRTATRLTRLGGFTRLTISALLVPALLLGGCATVPAASGPYGQVNRELYRQRAIVELAGGDAAVGVQRVILGPDETTWADEDGVHRVPTADIQRVIVVSHPSSSAWGWGWLALGVGAALAFALNDPLPLEIGADAAILVWEFGAEVPASVGRIVYSR